MRRILLSLIVLPLFTIAQQNYTIKGKLKMPKDSMTACVLYRIEDKSILDTALVQSGEFTIKGLVPYPLKAIVYLRPTKYGWFKNPSKETQIDIYLEKGTISIQIPEAIHNAVVGGSQLNADYSSLVKLLAPFNIEEAALRMAKRRAEDINADMDVVMAAYQELANRKGPAQEAFINNHLNSLVGLELLSIAIDPINNLNKAKSYFNKFPKELRESNLGRSYANLFNVAIGCQAPDFTALNLKSESVSLSAYRGKYVLLDFWASWCMPCRADHPHIRKLYDQYKSQDFAILGVSLDEDETGKVNWLKAIHMDNVTWDQVSELKGFKGLAPRLYGITAVPTNFLIDPSGKIIAKNLRGSELDQKLAELFHKS